MLQANCGCGETTYVFMDLDDKFTTCRKCGKKIYMVNCKNRECETGYCFSEGSKEIDLINHMWKCSVCYRENTSLPNEEIKNYHREEIPDEVWKEEGSRGNNSKLIPILIIIVALWLAYDFVKNFLLK